MAWSPRKRSLIGRNTRSLAEGLEARQLFTASVVSIIPDATGSPISPSTVDLPTFFTTDVDDATKSTVRLAVPTGNIDIGTLDAQVPINANNFKHYVTSGRYDNTVFQRYVAGFVLQGGSQTADGTEVESFGAIQSEPNGDRHNTRGTVAFARLDPTNGGGPDTATSGFFFNLADNSSNLDNQNGGFTVFGSVLGNGMSVVDALTQLDDNSRVISSAKLLPDLTYSVTSSDPSQVDAVINGDEISVSYKAINASSTITVTATDSNGSSATSSFLASSSGTDITLGGSTGNKSVTYTQTDGAVTTLSLKGSGSATLSLAGANLTSTSSKGKVSISGTPDVASVALTGTDTSTAVSISTKKGVSTIAGLTADGSVKSITGKKTALTGAITIAGTLQTLSTQSAATATISVGGSSGDKATTYSFGDISDVNIGSATPIKSLKVKSAIDAGGAAETIAAPAIASISSSGDFGIGISMADGNVGSIKVGGSLSGSISVHQVGSVSVKKDFTGTFRNSHSATEVVNAGGNPDSKNEQGIQSFKVGGSFAGIIRAAGTIGSFSAGSTATNALIVAGAPDIQQIPAAASDISEPASILSFKISKTMDSTFVIAKSIGKASVGTVVTTGTNTFGFYTTALGSLSAKTDSKKSISLKKPADQAAVDTKLSSLTLGGFAVKILV